MLENYYISQKSKLLRNFDKASKSVKRVLTLRYGDDLTDSIVQNARKEFEAVIPELPYIGGKKNMMTIFLIESAYCLALYKVLKSRSESIDEISRAIYEIVEVRLDMAPKFILRIYGKLKFGRLYLRRLRKQAARSQKRQYPGDWVFTFIEGDGREFDYGYDITECGLCKFLHAQNVDELAPFLCVVDFQISKAFGSGLVRTMTLAEGAEKCDFRYKRDRETQEGWPPAFLEGRQI